MSAMWSHTVHASQLHAVPTLHPEAPPIHPEYLNQLVQEMGAGTQRSDGLPSNDSSRYHYVKVSTSSSNS